MRWKRQNRLETVAFASTLVGVIAALPDTVHVDSEATFRVARSELSSNCYLGFWPTELNSYPPACYDSRGDGRRICIAGKPLYGVATLGGAEDSRSPLFDLGWKTGVRTTPRELQGVKQGALESSFIPDPFHPGRHLDLTPLIAPACYYPETMPLSFIQIESPSGTLAFAALPGELTRTAWWRVEQKLAKPYRVIPIGLANEYVGYVTTREEYAAQAYEGASTIFGPFSAELIQANLVDLSGALHPPIDEAHKIVQKRTFYPEAIRRRSTFGPDSKFMPTGHGFPDDGLENLILDDDGLPDRHWPRFAWHENVTEISDWNGGERFIEVLREGELAQATDDDAGPNLLTVAINPSDLTEETSQSEFERASRAPTVAEAADRKKKKRRRWTAIWLAPQSIAEDDSFYFRVTLKDAQRTRCSRLFTLKEVRGWDPPHRVMAGDCPQ